MIEQIRPAQVKAWLAAHAQAKPIVLDVREPAELQTASVQADGLTLVAIPMQSIPARVDELDKQQAIACLCHHGGRSMQVAHFLAQNGFNTVANIAGGIHVWSEEVDPTVLRY